LRARAGFRADNIADSGGIAAQVMDGRLYCVTKLAVRQEQGFLPHGESGIRRPKLYKIRLLLAVVMSPASRQSVAGMPLSGKDPMLLGQRRVGGIIPPARRAPDWRR
jgi:hypothetical protein